jgi:hypothetical protein
VWSIDPSGVITIHSLTCSLCAPVTSPALASNISIKAPTAGPDASDSDGGGNEKKNKKVEEQKGAMEEEKPQEALDNLWMKVRAVQCTMAVPG